MIAVIIAGGSGTRLWPLSTPDYPKHLLKLTGEKTLLQQAYERASRIADKVYVITEASHSKHVLEQLPELNKDHILVEPGRRGTANCIIFALDYIARHENKTEPVAFIHSDHNVRDIDGFARSFKLAARISSKLKEICLIGIEPTFPSTGFGYIERGKVIDEDNNIYAVKSFKEKPDLDLAKKYLATGRYLWNCGYFVGSVDIFINEMKRSAPDLYQTYATLSDVKEHSSKDYNKKYLTLSDQVIDKALIEKTKDLAVVSASFDWMDVGSFKDLYGVVEQDENGNYLKGDNLYALEVENSYIRNEENKPIAIIGLDNLVVVNTANGILISRRDVSQRTGEVAKDLQKKSRENRKS